MDGRIDLVTLISLIVAVVAIWKLRSVLGRRTGDDEARIEQRIRAQQAREQAAGRDKVVTLPRRDVEEAGPARTDQATISEVEARLKTYASDPAVERGLLAILRAEPSFDPEHFLSGAKQAYEMIVTAFAEGNRKILKDLLSREVFDGFTAAIAEREKRGEQIDQSFVGINRADIVEAELKNGIAQITVKFVSQLISATRDRSGEVIHGDPQRIKEVTDIWSFAREVASRNPNWRLVATQSAN
ncbi:MAG TPA: Tim44/TimA family putative adaptor protein [Hyphomicrobiaceae bacterium]|nr:Tim44/TimA family putative adaptor protein [Hyphomicrobiaceae bacterium]